MECPFADFDQLTAIYCDTGGNTGHIFKNRVWNINNRLPAAGAHGIHLESGCKHWVVEDNLIQNVGGDGLHNGSRGTENADDNKWLHNTVIGAKFGFAMMRGYDVVFMNNLLLHTEIAAVRVEGPAVNQAPNINYNLYWKSSPTKLGKWVDQVLDLEAWQEKCDCDRNSILADPLIMYTPSPESPAIGGGANGANIGIR
jgi:hypothetical protein